MRQEYSDRKLFKFAVSNRRQRAEGRRQKAEKGKSNNSQPLTVNKTVNRQPSTVNRQQIQNPYIAVFRRLWCSWWLTLSLIILIGVGGCTNVDHPPLQMALNSPATDEQPALSGNGQFLTFVSNRDGKRQILLYDFQQRAFIDLPFLHRGEAIAESPSISYTARYLVYLASDMGQSQIFLYDRMTRRSQLLTPGYRGWIRNPSISSDGRYIVFETGRRGQWDLEIIDRGPNIELDRPDVIPTQSERKTNH